MRKTILTIVLALIFTAPTLAQSKPDPDQVAIDKFSERLTMLLTREQAGDYTVDRDGAIVIRGQRHILPFTSIPAKRVKYFIKTGGVWSSRKGK
jgi:hypothetical protein